MTALYGAYPRGYLERIRALFPELGGGSPFTTLHAFSGSLPQGPYLRLDLKHQAGQNPELLGSVYDVARLLEPWGRGMRLVLADPPYSREDARRYGTPMVDRKRAMRALATVTAPGGYLVWLDTSWPQHRNCEWATVGRITLIRSTNHRVRLVSIFERGQ